MLWLGRSKNGSSTSFLGEQQTSVYKPVPAHRTQILTMQAIESGCSAEIDAVGQIIAYTPNFYSTL